VETNLLVDTELDDIQAALAVRRRKRCNKTQGVIFVVLTGDDGGYLLGDGYGIAWPDVDEDLDESFLPQLHPSVHQDFIECLEQKRREDEYNAREG
jgi:hypothetical protein